MTGCALLAGCDKNDAEASNVRTLRLAHSLDMSHPVHQAMVQLAERADELSNGHLRIQIYPSEQLGSERECLELVQLGVLDMTKVSSGVMEGFVPAFRVFGLPYLFRDRAHMWQVFDGDIGTEILGAGSDKGILGLCFYDAGARSFYTSERPIRTPADLQGLKIRVMKSDMSVRMVKAMGGSPTPIDWGELYTALEQGVVDGAENNPPSVFSSRHYEVCKYYGLDEHLRLPDVLVISPRVWARLADADRATLRDAVRESVEYEKELWAKVERERLVAIADAGVEVFEPERAPFRESVRGLWESFDGTDVGALAMRIQEVR